MRIHILFLAAGICSGFVAQQNRNRVSRSISFFDNQDVCKFSEIPVDATVMLEESILIRISELIDNRAKARWLGDYEAADGIRCEIETIQNKYLSPSLRIVICDSPRRLGGGSSWNLMYKIILEEKKRSALPSVLYLAQEALRIASFCSERVWDSANEFVYPLSDKAKARLTGWRRIHIALKNATFESKSGIGSEKMSVILGGRQWSKRDIIHWKNVENELCGRKAADAAFWFALSGTNDQDLFHLLTEVCVKEVFRFGERSSCRAKDIVNIMTRLAAAGVTDIKCDQLEKIEKIIYSKIDAQDNEFLKNTKNMLDLHSNSTGLLLWKQSFRRRPSKHLISKVCNENLLRTRSRDIDEMQRIEKVTSPWLKQFADLSKPLIVDIGCGMGLSLLGLASLSVTMEGAERNIDWSKYNYIGVDLSPLTINYARGIAIRWGISDRVCFVIDDAERFLDKIGSYPGGVYRLMIQFPTPFHLNIPSNSDEDSRKVPLEGTGNSKLPKSFDEGFMITPALMNVAAELLKKSNGELLLQSNCEDVAVRMRQLALEVSGFIYISTDFVNVPIGSDTMRTLSWISMGGQRAIGPGWSPIPILPSVGRTETEIACIINDVPVHRCILTIR